MESALPLHGSWGEVALAMLNAFAEHWDVPFKVTNCSFDRLTITVVGNGLRKIKKAGKGGVFRIKLEDYKVYKNVLVHEPISKS